MEATTAIATIVLALLTGVYVVLTGRLAKQAKESAEAARRSADSAERGRTTRVEPLVVCRFGGGSPQSYALNLNNLGRSVALSVVATVAEANGEGVATIFRDALPAGEDWRAGLSKEASPEAAVLASTGGYELSATYVSALGQQFRTVRSVTRSDGGPPVTSTTTWTLDRDRGEWRRLF